MAIVINRWRSKPTHIEEVAVTEENFREVAAWLGAEKVSITFEADQTFVRFEGLPENIATFNAVSVLVGESVYKEKNGNLRLGSIEELKKHYKRV